MAHKKNIKEKTGVLPVGRSVGSSHWQKEEYIAWVILGAGILFVVIVRLRLLSIPLERDEGGFAYMGQLLLDGIPPYTQAYDFKPPGLYASYAVFIALFGASAAGIHLGLLITNIASTLLVFLLSRKIVGSLGASLAGASFAILALSPTVLGFAAHATHFVVLHALIGTLLLLNALEKKNTLSFFWSGLFFGLCYLMKQQGVFFSLFAVTVIVAYYFQQKPFAFWNVATRTIVLGLGALTPLLVASLILFLANAFEQFWFWCFVYTSTFGSGVPVSSAVNNFMAAFPPIVTGFSPLWILAGTGLAVTASSGIVKQDRLFILAFFFFSLLSICPGFYFRQHYFILSLPAISLLIAVAFLFARDFLARRFSPTLAFVVLVAGFIGAAAFGISKHQWYFFKESPTTISRLLYGPNPFPEDIDIAKVLESRMKPEDKVVVLGSEPQIYFYSKRRAGSGHIFTYWLVEPHPFARTMQEQMIAEIEASRPTYLVFVNVGMSWAMWPQSEKLIFEWYETYSRAHYDLAGMIDIHVPGKTDYYWDEEARTHSPTSDSFIVVLKRKDLS